MYGPIPIMFGCAAQLFIVYERLLTYEIEFRALNSQYPSEAILHLTEVLMNHELTCMLDGLTG